MMLSNSRSLVWGVEGAGRQIGYAALETRDGEWEEGLHGASGATESRWAQGLVWPGDSEHSAAFSL